MTRMEKYKELRDKIKLENIEHELDIEFDKIKEITVADLVEMSRKRTPVRPENLER